MKYGLTLFGAAVVGGLATGWLTAAPTTAPAADERTLHGVQAHYGAERIGTAREQLVALGYAEPLALASEASPPSPPDISVLFRRDLTAIEQGPDGPLVWILDLTREFGRRSLKPGDVYQDGWRISAVSEQVIELRRRRELRRVAVFNPPREIEP